MGLIIFLINFSFDVYYLLILARAALSWTAHNPHHPLIRPIYSLTEPLLINIRKALPPYRIGMDASPFIALILLWILQQIILRILS